MGMMDNNGLPDGGAGIMPSPAFEVKPRVFVSTPGEEYEEIADVKSFERHDAEQGGARILLVMAEDQASAVKDILSKGSDHYVNVKMEFMIGMLMVMSFSGFVDEFSGGKVGFAVSTPIATDVLDIAQ